MLYLMRHGEAEHGADSDAGRRLTQRGITEVRRAAGLLPHGRFRILHSPYRRAGESAELLAGHLASTAPEVVDWLKPDVAVTVALTQLDSLDSGHEHTLLVSHNPLVSLLAADLSGLDTSRVRFGTGGLARLSGTPWQSGCLTLHWESDQ